MSFASMKKRSKSSIADLAKQMETESSGSSYNDDRIWTCERDKTGKGEATIRFLPAAADEDFPWVKKFNHGFQDNGWFIENCPTTLGKECPVCAGNNELWQTGIEANKNIARKRKRKLSYYSNILVIKDPKNPDNEGKIFLFRYGKVIHDMIENAMSPEFDDETPINPFDFWAGADFKLKIVNKDGYANYDKSSFAKPSALMDGDDAQLEALWKLQHPLLPLVADSEFKDYDALEARFNTVTKKAGASVTSSVENVTTPAITQPLVEDSGEETAIEEGESSDDMDYFDQLANG